MPTVDISIHYYIWVDSVSQDSTRGGKEMGDVLYIPVIYSRNILMIQMNNILRFLDVLIMHIKLQ